MPDLARVVSVSCFESMGVMDCFDARRLWERGGGGTEGPGLEDSMPISEVLRFMFGEMRILLLEGIGASIEAPDEVGLMSVFARTNLTWITERKYLVRVPEAKVLPLRFEARIHVSRRQKSHPSFPFFLTDLLMPVSSAREV